MAYISRQLREQVTLRAHGHCEYCQTSQLTVVEMAVDHIIPEVSGGPTTLENLCLCCISCNSYKNDFRDGIDPVTHETIPLFNPRLEAWKDHFAWDSTGTQLVGLSAAGRATIARLKINRDLRVLARERWVKAGWHPPMLD